MKILLTSIGSSGDINPFIALSAALQNAGHDVRLLVNPFFKDAVEVAGVPFLPYGEYLSPIDVAKDHPLGFNRYTGGWVLFRKFFLPYIRDFYEGIRDAAEDFAPDVMIGHQISFGLPWVAQKMGIPWATCTLAPATILSTDDPSRMPLGHDFHNWPRWYRKMSNEIIRTMLAVSFDPTFNTMRKELGLPKRRDIFFGEMLSGNAVLALWSPSWRPKANDDPPTMTICGFPWQDSPTDNHPPTLQPQLEQFLDAGDPPIVFSLGSVLSHTSHGIHALAHEVCHALGTRGVLVSGHEDSAPDDLPDSIIRVDYAPYSALFPRAKAVIHHGGIGTTAQVLRAGVPSVILPHAHDQFDNAARCVRHGLAAMLMKRGLRAQVLARTLKQLTESDDVQHNARKLASNIQTENGVQSAVKVIERIAC